MGKSKWLKGLGVVLSLALLAGCSGQSKEAKAPGQAGDEILIGANFELSGDVATYGTSSLNSAMLYFDEVNAKGGINGKKIKIVKYDNKSDKAESLSVVTRLVTQDKVSAVIGPVTSGNTLSVVTFADDKKVPVITPTATNPDVTVDPKTGKVHDYVFRTCFLDSFQGKAAAEFALKKGAKNAVVLVSQADEYSKGLGKFFKETFTAGGGTIAGEEAFDKNDNDYLAILTKVKGKNPDVIYLPAYYEAVGKIVKQARGLGITATFVGSDGWDSPKLTEVAGKDNLNNCFFTNHYTPEDPDPAVQAFVKAYKEKYGQVPDALGALAYDGARLLVDAIERAGSAEPQKIKEALAATKDFPAVTGKFTLNENHDPVKDIVIVELKDGLQTVHSKLKAQ
ncbi:ABC transporter substrate-binding protein [Heliobacterium undosum]|uniref:ABC transporter substrate-binding protein n=1 Tax=Heliomicrobium undosum TaxID=121734 RepID=A0A845KXD6_9FIRM|nr:ABC transporter substrate-binding protein [Heliomicrobium undosum]MZP28212.1 ABC transporter substrate-binding protein [Heliomicrobium undosum]